ncbi:MAG: biotin/lipoyl-containing protein [Caldilineaceae bacterium]
MATAVKMPQLGESVVEGTIARWLKAPGETIAKYEPLLEISTDKIDTEVPAPAAGTLLEIVAPEGETVAVGATLAYIGQPGEIPTASTTATKVAPVQSQLVQKTQPRHDSDAITQSPNHPVAHSTHTANTESPKPAGRAFISPVVARIADQHQIDLEQVPGAAWGTHHQKTFWPLSKRKHSLLYNQLPNQPTNQLSNPHLTPTKRCSPFRLCAVPLPSTWCSANGPAPM